MSPPLTSLSLPLSFILLVTLPIQLTRRCDLLFSLWTPTAMVSLHTQNSHPSFHAVPWRGFVVIIMVMVPLVMMLMTMVHTVMMTQMNLVSSGYNYEALTVSFPVKMNGLIGFRNYR